jgi:phage-related protein
MVISGCMSRRRKKTFLPAAGVVQVSRGDHHHQRQAAGVNHKVPLAAIDLLPAS